MTASRQRDSADDHDDWIRTSAVPRRAAVGSTLGRYVLIERVGAGAMGVVYRAYDPKLRREVALKCIAGAGHDAETEARMTREARAMAQLRSPNVVGVFDVETIEGGLTLVMEYVPGSTLATWLAEPRDWSSVLDAFLQAGRGLAAAHRCGLLHRDFKPSNVLVGQDGRVRVTDFGLARSIDDHSSAAEGWTQSSDGAAADLTEHGALLGTPAYMPPEQLDGLPIDERADVYAFCSSLWQAFTGRLPFARASDPNAWAELKRSGPPPWPADLAVPSGLLTVVRRGLLPDPRERWASMHALLGELERRRNQRRRRSWVGALGGLAIVSGGLGWQFQPDSSCSGGPEHLAPIWNDARGRGLNEAFEAAGSPMGTHLRARVDDFARAWIDSYERACTATMHEGRPEAELDLRMVCLERARGRLDAALDVLERGDATVVARTVEVLSTLGTPTDCDDVSELRNATPRPRDLVQLAIVERGEAAADHVRALYHAGEFDEAWTAARAAQNELGSVPYAPLRVELLLLAGQLDVRFDRLDAGLRAFRDAFGLALEADLPGLAVESAARALDVVGSTRNEFGPARAWAALAEALAGSPGVSSTQRAAMWANRAMLASDLGDYATAEADMHRAIALHTEAHGPESLEVALDRDRLGLVLSNRGRFDESEREHRVALAIRERALGPNHLVTAESRANLGEQLRMLGRYAEAEAELGAALEVFEATVGRDTANADAVRNNLANVYFAWARYDRAEALYTEVLDYRRRRLGPEHAETASALSNLGMVQHMRGQFDQAEASYRGALATIATALGEDHPSVATRRSNLGSLLRERGRLDEARTELLLAVRGLERSVGDAHVHTGIVRANYASVLSELGRHDEAFAELERGLARVQAILGPEHVDVLVLRYQLGLAYRKAEQYERAEALQRSVLESRRRQLGGDHPDVAESLGELGNVLYFQRRLREAEACHREALAMRERLEGLDAAEPAFEHLNLGTVLTDQRRFDEAEASYRRALALWEAAHGDKDGRVAAAADALGDLEALRGRPVEARAWLERAWSIRSSSEGDPAEVAETAASLARILWTEPAERQRAVTLARDAERRYASAGPLRRRELEQVRRWLARHRVRSD